MATLKSATNPPSREQLLAEVALEIQAMAQQRQNPLKGYKPTAAGSSPGEQVVEELHAVQASSPPRPRVRRRLRTGGGWSPQRSQRLMPPRRVASWGSAPSGSARESKRCSTRCAPPSPTDSARELPSSELR